MDADGDATDVLTLLAMKHRQHFNASKQPKPVAKTNPMKIYMHYMPWFQSKDFSGFWGYHWKMTNRNPDVIEKDGRRQIASHYYPLIGPYDSKDPDVIAYHLLLMRYSGIDGVLIDWYGSHKVHDFGPNLENSNALISGSVGRRMVEVRLRPDGTTGTTVWHRLGGMGLQAVSRGT